MGEAMRRTQAETREGAEDKAVWTTERLWSVGLNLYALSDGRFWLDDVANDRQGFITADQAIVIKRFVKRHTSYSTEPLSALLDEYSANTGRSVEELARPFEIRGPLSAFPGHSFELPAQPASGAPAMGGRP